MTFIYVTHDQDEALTMSNRIAVFNKGKIEQIGTPAEVYEHPSTEFVAGFVGTSNVIDRDGRRVTIRPEKIKLLAAEATEGEPAVIRAAVYLGAITRYVCVLDAGGELAVVQQNLETSSSDVHEMEGRRVRLAPWLASRPRRKRGCCLVVKKSRQLWTGGGIGRELDQVERSVSTRAMPWVRSSRRLTRAISSPSRNTTQSVG